MSVLVTLACAGWTASAHAESKLPPEVGYNYGQTETPRIGGMGGATRAMSQSIEAVFVNPANMATSRVYHAGALAQIWPEASRQTYGLAIVDSIVSSSRLAGGLAGSFSSQDPSGIDRSSFDVRFALAYPFSDAFYVGAGARYLSLKQAGFPSGVYDLRPSIAASGRDGKPIVQDMTFDAGLTVKPMSELAFSLVGYNLTDPGNSLLPFMLGGGAGYGTTQFTIEADLLGDFSTYGDTKLRAMAGGELLAAGRFPIRGGYRYDQGRQSHTATFGVGYTDPIYAFDISVLRGVSGDAFTAILIGFRYHVESAGLTSGRGEAE